MDSFSQLKCRLGGTERDVLDTIWLHFLKTREWIAEREIKYQIETPEVVLDDIVSHLGEWVVFKTWEDNAMRYKVTFPGMLLSSYGGEVESLLENYLRYVIKQYQKAPMTEHIQGSDYEKDMDVTKDISAYTRDVINISHLWGGSGAFGNTDTWYAGFPEDISRLRYEKDLIAYIRSKAMAYYDMPQPGLFTNAQPWIGEADKPENTTPQMKNFKYDIALSFAGEDREIVEDIARQLTNKDVRVFYDKYEEAGLWGKDLYDHLSDVYQHRARYCILFLSRHYADKVWTNHERQNAQVRAMEEKGEYILPVHLDDTDITAIRKTVGYLDFRQHGVDGVVNNTLKKLGLNQVATAKSPKPQIDVSIPLPEIKKSITQRDQDLFLNNGFEYIQHYFNRALSQLDKANPDVDIAFHAISKEKFTVNIYVDENKRCQCKIWIGGLTGSNSIAYAEGQTAENSNDSSMNDFLVMDIVDGELRFKTTMGDFVINQRVNDAMTTEQAAEYLWRRFTAPLSR